jgi:flagellar basal body-associated protein FliL
MTIKIINKRGLSGWIWILIFLILILIGVGIYIWLSSGDIGGGFRGGGIPQPPALPK